MFDPRILMMGVPSRTNSLSCGWRNAAASGTFDFLQRIPSLRRLTLMNWDPVVTGGLPLLPSLESLTLYELQFTTLAPVQGAMNIRELHLVALRDEKVRVEMDLKGLGNFPRIEILGFLQSDKARLPGLERVEGPLAEHGHGVLHKRNSRVWLSPEPNLRMVTIFMGEEITDLSPLKELEHLESLALFTDEKQSVTPMLGIIREMKSLQYVMLSQGSLREASRRRSRNSRKSPSERSAGAGRADLPRVGLDIAAGSGGAGRLGGETIPRRLGARREAMGESRHRRLSAAAPTAIGLISVRAVRKRAL